MITITKYDGDYYIVRNRWGEILTTKDVYEAYREYQYQKHTLANIDTEDAESLTLSKEVYANGRLIDSYDYEDIYD